MPLTKAKAYTRITDKAQKSTGRPQFNATDRGQNWKSWKCGCCQFHGTYDAGTWLCVSKASILWWPLSSQNTIPITTTPWQNQTGTEIYSTIHTRQHLKILHHPNFGTQSPPALPKTTIKTELTIQLFGIHILFSKYTTLHDHRFALKRPGSMTVSHYDTFSRNHSCAHSVRSSFPSHWQLGEENKPSHAAVSCDPAMTKVSLVLQT